jgi:hypothetical protein
MEGAAQASGACAYDQNVRFKLFALNRHVILPFVVLR